MSDPPPDSHFPVTGGAPASSTEPPTARIVRDEVLEGLWAAVLERWDDMAPHQAALARAVESESLADLAARYRKLAGDPAKKERAEERLQAILGAATVLLMSKKTPAQKKSGLSAFTWITLVACAGALYQLAKMMAERR